MLNMIAKQALRATTRQLAYQNRNQFSSTSRAQADFTHAVIGGGVVGTAIARQLANRPDTSTVLIERHGAIGTETSSRNSEVIHAGIYYGADTLKSKLCIRGKQLLYSLCEKHDVPHRNTGKWIVAQNDTQREALEKIHVLCRDTLGVPTRWVSDEEIARDGQGVRAAAGALESPSTGIVDSHSLMTCLIGLFENSGGVLALNSPVQGLRQTNHSQWEVDVLDGSSGEQTTISAETIINAAGLGAVDIHNMIVPSGHHRRLYYAKGNYFSYSASSPSVSRLIYPAPEPGAGGLGTHLTLDMGGRMRFGPDVEWVEDPTDLAVSASRLQEAVKEIKKYLPGVDETCLEADYAGIRPKLASRGAVMTGNGFNDFIIRKEEGYQGWVNLLGIESPGLTSCIAIAEMVEELLYGSTGQAR